MHDLIILNVSRNIYINQEKQLQNDFRMISLIENSWLKIKKKKKTRDIYY